MSISNFIPEIWEAQLLLTLRKNLTLTQLTNSNYQGAIGGVGDVLHIQTPAALTVNPYTPRSTTISYEVPTSTTKTLTIDQDFYWAFSVDDLEQVQSNVNLFTAYRNEGAYAMADALDQHVAAKWSDAAHSVSLDISVNADGVRAALIDAGVKLDEANVPSGGRWLAVNPTLAGAMREAYGDRMTALGDTIVTRGYLGFVEGFNVFMSNNIALSTTRKNLFGTNAAITMAFDLNMIEAIRLEDAFEDGVRSRLVWGSLTVRPEALGVIDTTEPV